MSARFSPKTAGHSAAIFCSCACLVLGATVLAEENVPPPNGAAATPAPTPAAQPVEAEESPAEPTAPTVWPPGLLMQSLDTLGLRTPMQEAGVRVYGYVETGMTFKLHGPLPRRDGLALRCFEARRTGNLRLNQTVLTVDRPVDTSKSFDIGGRFDVLYGTDARLIHSLGMFDTNQLDHDVNYDIPQGYGELWFGMGPGGRGLDVTFGKWFSTHGAEVFSAVGNYLYSRSLLYVYGEPTTHTGLKLTYAFDPANSVYFAIVRGWDQFKDANSMPTWMTGFTVSGTDQVGGNPRSQLAFNFIIGPEQSGRYVGENRLLTDVVWTWRWTDKLTQVMNFDWGWEDSVPGALNDENVPGRGDAAWYGLSYMLNYVINEHVATTGRFDWFTDNAGVRTGYRGTFFEATAGLAITPFPNDPVFGNLLLRPELRADWSANDAPFAEECQWTAAFDIVYRF